MTELWKDVDGYEGLYQVSNLGNVRSVDREYEVTRNGVTFMSRKEGKRLTPVRRRHGYLGVMLYGKGGHAKRGFRTFSVHRLVAKAFIENPNGYTEVNHLDECKTNNRADNLEWCDRKYNTNYGTTQKRRSEIMKNDSRSSKKVMQMDIHGNEIKIWPSLHEIQRQLGYWPSTISNCCNHRKQTTTAYGYRWEYITL
jgi:hypothetical protein